jgi:signal transduction histidine kinase
MSSASNTRTGSQGAAALMRRARPILGLDGLFLMRVDPRARLLRLVEAVGVTGAARRLLEERPPRAIEEVVAGPWSAGLSCAAVPVRVGRRGAGCLVGFTRGPGQPPDSRALRVLAEALGAHVAASRPPSGSRGLRQHEHLKIFYRVSVLAAARSAARDVGSRVLKEFCAALRLTRGEIWILDGRGGGMRRLCSCGPVGEPRAGIEPLARAYPLTRRLLRRGRPLLVQEAGRRGAGGAYTHLDWPRLRALYGVPLRRPGRFVGFLFADQGGRPLALPPADRDLAAALAGLISEVVDSALAREIERKRHRQLVLLNRASQAISGEDRLDALLPRLTALVRETERCQGVVIGLYETGAREIAVRAITGPGSRQLRAYRFPVRRSQPASCLGSQAFLRQRPIRIDDASRLPRTSLYWPESRSVLVIPIHSKHRPLGVLRLEALAPRTFDEADAEVYAILGEQIGRAIERSQVLQDLRVKQADLRRVSENLEAMLEDDRRRLARELQEELAQALTAAKLTLGLASDLAVAARPDLSLALHDVDVVLDQTIEKSRRIAADLRPVMLDELGLMPTLRWYTDAFARRTGIRVALRTQGAEPEVRPEQATLLFRFAQDALGRVERAGTAKRALVSLGGNGAGPRLVVWDDGDMRRAAGLRDGDSGLLAMRERIERAGGTLHIDAREGLGTRCVADLGARPAAGPGGPLPAAAAARAGRPARDLALIRDDGGAA